ncbi:MAG: hypothetical protein LPK09_10225 [Hymenobacteraceae bacterium]|nr:hypothetical protein [Hymenobacteraceae bacterium]
MKLTTLLVVILLACTASNAQHAKAPNCDEPAHHQFDFWLGEWNIKQKILMQDGSWFEAKAQTEVKQVLGGCALLENWSGEVLFFWEGMQKPEELRGLSVRAYNPKSKKWSINWMDNRNLQFGEHTGEFANGKGEFYRTITSPEGKEITTRITFSDMKEASVHWDLAVTSDAGKTWTVLWIMEMKRK